MLKRKRVAKQVLCAILSAALVFTSVNTPVYAAEQDANNDVIATEEIVEISDAEESAEIVSYDEEVELNLEDEEVTEEVTETEDTTETEEVTDVQEDSAPVEITEELDTVDETIDVTDTSEIEVIEIVETQEEDVDVEDAMEDDVDSVVDETVEAEETISDNEVTISENEIEEELLMLAEYEENGFHINGSILVEYTGSAEEVVIPDIVRTVGSSAFKLNKTMKKVVIGEGVTEIQTEAFYGAENLATVDFSTSKPLKVGANVFAGCNISKVIFSAATKEISKSLFENAGFAKDFSITIPENVAAIRTSAFKNAVNLTEVKFEGKKLTVIEDSAFYNCGNLKSVNFPDSLKTIGTEAFAYCVSMDWLELPSDLTKVASGAFYGDKGIKDVFVNSKNLVGEYKADSKGIFGGCAIERVYFGLFVTRVPEYLFQNAGLANGIEIEIPRNVETIGKYAFAGCSKIEKVTFATNDSKLTKIETNAFKDCTKIKTLVIPNSVTSIGSSAFENCGYLTSVTIGKGLKTLGKRAFYNCGMLSKLTIKSTVLENCDEKSSIFQYCSLSSVTFENGLVTVPEYLFYKAKFETGAVIRLPKTVETIGKYAFYECSGLREVQFVGNKLTAINASAFEKCNDLVEIDFPNSLVNLGNRAFYDCDNDDMIVRIPKLTSLSTNTIATNAFEKYAGKIYLNGDTPVYNFLKDTAKVSTKHFVTKIVNITYELNGGINDPENYLIDRKDNTFYLRDPQKAGYEFQGWYTSSSFKAGTEIYEIADKGKTVYAKWDRLEYGINYLYDYGNSPENYILKSGTPINSYNANKEVKLPVLQSAGYHFKGWIPLDMIEEDGSYKEGASVLTVLTKNMDTPFVYRNLTLVPVWKEYTYTVKFNTNGTYVTAKTGSNKLDSFEIAFTNSFKVYSADYVERPGYTLVGWNSKKNGKGTAYNFNEFYSGLATKDKQVVTLYAQWQPIEYSISYDLNDADNDIKATNHEKNPSTHTMVKSVALKKPTRPGYTFVGWYLVDANGHVLNKVTSVKTRVNGFPNNKPVMLKAVWKENTVNIKFNVNGGKKTFEGKTMLNTRSKVPYTTTVKLPGAESIESTKGLTFKGWTLKKNDPSTLYQPGAEVSRLKNKGTVTLYAYWGY